MHSARTLINWYNGVPNAITKTKKEMKSPINLKLHENVVIIGSKLKENHLFIKKILLKNSKKKFHNFLFNESCRNGNVALDCARILLKDPDLLSDTDITENALRELKSSKVKNVFIVGRNGPLESKFSVPELREVIRLENVQAICDQRNFLDYKDDYLQKSVKNQFY